MSHRLLIHGLRYAAVLVAIGCGNLWIASIAWERWRETGSSWHKVTLAMNVATFIFCLIAAARGLWTWHQLDKKFPER